MRARIRRQGARALVGLGLLACACTIDIGTPQEPGTGTGTGTSSSSGSAPGSTSTGSATTRGTGQAGSESTTAVVDGSSGDPPPPVPPTCPSVRSEVDRPDDSLDPQVRVLYVIPSDAPDEGLDTSGQICNSVLSWEEWLFDETQGRILRLDTEANVLDIGFVRLDLTDAVMHGTSDAADIDTGFAYVRDRIERELGLLGLLAPHKLYAVYYGGTSQYACGGGAYPPILVGQVGAMYLGGEIPGFAPCDEAPWGQADFVPRYIEYGMLHELVHSLGVVDLLAPHEHSTGHAFDENEPSPERDLMYAPRPGTSDPPWGVYAPGGLRLDLGRDDYFEQPDGDLADLSRSAFLEPMPDAAVLPPGW